MLSPATHFRLFVTLSAVILVGCSAEKHPEPTESNGHSRMLTVLKEIAERTDVENEFLGNAELWKMRADLSRLPPNAPVRFRFDLLRLIGNHEIRIGENHSAVNHLLAAHKLLPKVQDEVGDEVGDEIAEFALLDLAVSYLRIGEIENCVECNSGASCLVPIRDEGVHLKQDGSRNAIRYLLELLERNPESLPARWLLNIALMTIGGYPHDVPTELLIPPEAFESDEPFPRFVNISSQLRLNSFNLSGGTVVDDFDNDGYLDILTSTSDTKGQIRYFRNNADGTFSDRTAEAGLVGLLGGLNLVQADYNNDGHVDVLVLRGGWLGENGRHPNSLLKNNGHGRFTDVTFAAGLADVNHPSLTAAWGDYDNDGWLDLYVGNEAAACQLFHNDGKGHFTDVARQAGVENYTSIVETGSNGHYLTKGVVWGDYNNDRFPDLYVSNYLGLNRLYRNNGNGTFTDVASEKGVTGPIKSFPAWFWDFDNDGALDLFVSSYWAGLDYETSRYLGLPSKAESARLYRGDHQGGFQDVAAKMNLQNCSAPMGCNFGDLDNDGFLDFYLGTGWPEFEGLVPNLMYHNRRGIDFANVTTAAGFGHLQKGHGVAFADLDNDGDQDVFIQLGGALKADGFYNALFENPGFDNHWIKVRLIGNQSNRSSIGVRIRVEIHEDGTSRSIFRYVCSGGSFGANPLRQEIGLGQAEKIDLLEIYWPTTNTTQRFHDLKVNQTIEITEGQPEIREQSIKKLTFR